MGDKTEEMIFWGLQPGETRLLPDDFLDQNIDKISYEIGILTRTYGPHCKMQIKNGKIYVYRPNELNDEK